MGLSFQVVSVFQPSCGTLRVTRVMYYFGCNRARFCPTGISSDNVLVSHANSDTWCVRMSYDFQFFTAATIGYYSTTYLLFGSTLRLGPASWIMASCLP